MSKSENKGKSIDAYLHLLIKRLHHLQHKLDFEFCSEKFIHNKLFTAYCNVFACQYAYFKLVDNLASFINDLHLSIATFKANSSTNNTYFTNYCYH